MTPEDFASHKARLWGRYCAQELHKAQPHAKPEDVHADMWLAGAKLIPFLRQNNALSDDAMSMMLQAYADHWAKLTRR